MLSFHIFSLKMFTEYRYSSDVNGNVHTLKEHELFYITIIIVYTLLSVKPRLTNSHTKIRLLLLLPFTILFFILLQRILIMFIENLNLMRLGLLESDALNAAMDNKKPKGFIEFNYMSSIRTLIQCIHTHCLNAYKVHAIFQFSPIFIFR